MKILRQISVGILLISTCLTGACSKKSESLQKVQKNNADVAVDQKAQIVFKSFDDEGTAFKGYDKEFCSVVDCRAPDEPEWWNAFKDECQSAGHKLIALGCCGPYACTGKVSPPDGEGSGEGDSESIAAGEGQKESIGQLVYKSFTDKGSPFEGFSPSKCDVVRCKAPEVSPEWETFSAACVKQDFKVIATGCCDQKACTGLPSP